MASPGRAEWLRQAREILAQDHGARPGRVKVTVEREDGASVVFTLPAEESEDGRPPAALSPLEREIVKAVRAAGVLTAKAVAQKIHAANSGGFRAILANLCEREPPVLESSGQGYRLAGVSDK